MPSRVVRQPNGLLAVFSTVVDDFTRMDLTESEALRWAREHMGRADAEAKVRRGLDDENPWTGERGDGLSRWRDALETVRAVHGEARAGRRRRAGETEVTP
jgi:hypothetical protein